MDCTLLGCASFSTGCPCVCPARSRGGQVQATPVRTGRPEFTARSRAWWGHPGSRDSQRTSRYSWALLASRREAQYFRMVVHVLGVSHYSLMLIRCSPCRPFLRLAVRRIALRVCVNGRRSANVPWPFVVAVPRRVTGFDMRRAWRRPGRSSGRFRVDLSARASGGRSRCGPCIE